MLACNMQLLLRRTMTKQPNSMGYDPSNTLSVYVLLLHTDMCISTREAASIPTLQNLWSPPTLT